MRILLTFESGLINGTGGAEKVCISMANWFSRKGHDVKIVTSDENNGRPFYYLNPEVDFVNLWYSRYSDWMSDRLKKYEAWYRAVEDMMPDVVITSGITDVDIITRLATPPFPIINVCNGRPDFDYANIYNFKRSPEWVQRLKTLWYRIYGTNVFFESYKKFLPEDIKARVKVIPNIVRMPKEPSYLTSKNIVFLGRFDENQKNQFESIIAFSRSKACIEHGWQFHLYGAKSSYRDICQKWIDENGFSNSIFIHNPRPDVENIYKDASIFLSSARWEGFPLALTEALSYGIPCISRHDCCGSNELIKDKVNGYLYYDEIDLTYDIDLLASNLDLMYEMSEAAQESVCTYTEDYVMNLWMELITEVINDRKLGKCMSV